MRSILSVAVVLVASEGVTAQQGAVMPASLGEALPPAVVHGLGLRPSAPLEFSRAWLHKTDEVRRQRADLHARGLLDGARPEDLARLGGALSGELRVPIIAVRYADVAEPFPSHLIIDRLFGPSRGDTLSFADYWSEVSGGLLRVDGAVTSWVALRRPARYYLSPEDYGWGRFGRVAELRQQVLAAVDRSIDWGEFDNDGPDGVPNSGDDDGYVDFVVFLYATSCGENSLDGAIWPHRGTMPPFVTSSAAAGGGRIKIADYVILPAQAPGTCEPAHIGVLAHETGHAFGMPDLYDYDGSSPGIGPWGLMGTGSHNSPHSPSHPGAWMKEQLGWVGVEWLEADRPASLPAMLPSRHVFRYDIPDRSGRYLLMENRTRAGADRYLPEEGLLVWGIDPERAELAAWNTDERRPAIGLLRTDPTGGLATAGGFEGGGAFPGRGPARRDGDRVPVDVDADALESGSIRVRVAPLSGPAWSRSALALAVVAHDLPLRRRVEVRDPVGGEVWLARTSAPWLRLERSGSGIEVEADPLGLAPGRYSEAVELVEERTGRVLDRLTVGLRVMVPGETTVVASELPWGWGLAFADGAIYQPGSGWDVLGLRPRPRLLRVGLDDPFPGTVARLPLEAIYSPTPDPDGGVYILGLARGQNYVYHIDAEGNATVRGGSLGSDPAYGLARHRDGSLLVAGWAGRIQRLDVHGQLSTWAHIEQPIYQIATDEHGSVYAALLAGHALRIDPDGFSQVLHTGFDRGRLVAITVGPDGRAFAAERGGQGRIVELGPAGPRTIARIEGGEFYGLAADARFLYALDLRHRQLVRIPIDGPGVRPLAAAAAP